jgi:ABC-type transport system involved in multi-copper enzyme maturation permease subunit
MGDASLATAGMEEEATPRGKRRKRRKIGARTTSREVSDNPVFWREWRQASFSSPRLTRVVLALTLILLLVLYATVGFDKREVHGTVLFIAVLGVVLQGVFTTSMAFGNERESRTWDVLLTTPLSAWRITFGKFVGVLKALWFFPAIALADLVLAAISGVVSPMLALHAILIMLGPAVLLSSVGTTCGLLFRRGMSAAVATLAVALAIWLLCWPALGVLAGAMRLVDHETTDLIARVLYFINPIAMMMSAVEGAGDIYARNRYEVGEGPGSAYALFEFTRLTIFVLLGYLGVSAGLLALAVSRFNRWAPRTS